VQRLEFLVQVKSANVSENLTTERKEAEFRNWWTSPKKARGSNPEKIKIVIRKLN